MSDSQPVTKVQPPATPEPATGTTAPDIATNTATPATPAVPPPAAPATPAESPSTAAAPPLTSPKPTATTPPEAITPSAPAADAEKVAAIEPVKEPIIEVADGGALSEAEDEMSSKYIFGDTKLDRDRLEAQTRLFSGYLRENARRFIRGDVHNVLDVGCGEGQLTLVLSRIFPQARIVGVDMDARAIETAKRQLAQAPNITGKVEFYVGNIQEELPEGPFDLVYASLVMMHLMYPEKTMSLIKEVLRPGGYIWLKDSHKDAINSVPNTTWIKMFESVRETMLKIGRDTQASRKFVEQLSTLGYTRIDEKIETYQVTNATFPGRIMIGIALAGLYNARKLIDQMKVMPEEEFLKMHRELSGQAGSIKGTMPFTNVIAQKPLPSDLLLESELTPEAIVPVPAPAAPPAAQPTTPAASEPPTPLAPPAVSSPTDESKDAPKA